MWPPNTVRLPSSSPAGPFSCLFRGRWWRYDSTIPSYWPVSARHTTTSTTPRICQSEIRPEQIHILCPSLRVSGHLPATILNGSASRLRAIDEGVAEVAKRTQSFAVFCTKYTSYAHLTFVKYFITNPNSIWIECFKPRLKRFHWNSTHNLVIVYILPPPETEYPLSWIFM